MKEDSKKIQENIMRYIAQEKISPEQIYQDTGVNIANIKVMRSVKWYYTLLLPVFILVLTVVMVPIRLLGLMLCSDDMEWGTRKLEEDNDKVEVP